MLYIHIDEWAECGSGELACPMEVIFCEDGVPWQRARFTAEKASLFDPARLARRRVQDRAAALRHRLCHQLRHRR